MNKKKEEEEGVVAPPPFVGSCMCHLKQNTRIASFHKGHEFQERYLAVFDAVLVRFIHQLKASIGLFQKKKSEEKSESTTFECGNTVTHSKAHKRKKRLV